jgi:hypothetical protein
MFGALYGVGLALWGMLMSGGGHFNLLFVLFISPAGVGLLFWPLWGYLTAGAMSRVMRIAFLSTAAIHYSGLIYYVFGTGNSDLYWFRIGNRQPAFGFLVLFSVALYLAGQIFMWRRFVNAEDMTH